MPEPRTCHLPNNMASVCFGQTKAIKQHGTDFVVSYITELEGQR